MRGGRRGGERKAGKALISVVYKASRSFPPSLTYHKQKETLAQRSPPSDDDNNQALRLYRKEATRAGCAPPAYTAVCACSGGGGGEEDDLRIFYTNENVGKTIVPVT